MARTLTPQESAVVQMIAEGHQNKEMAALGISDKTLEHHRHHAMQKLGLHDVASLTRYAIRQRMVPAEGPPGALTEGRSLGLNPNLNLIPNPGVI